MIMSQEDEKTILNHKSTYKFIKKKFEITTFMMSYLQIDGD